VRIFNNFLHFVEIKAVLEGRGFRPNFLGKLTGIANRREFDRVFRLEWRRLAREQLPLSLIMFDIDFFKLYNEFYGHVGGGRLFALALPGRSP
jgi:PleD family two-component response regulator